MDLLPDVAEGRGAGAADETIDMCKGTSAEDNKFDSIVGALEELLLDEEFVSLQDGFCEEHCHVFEDTEENKLEYTEIFVAYTERIEGFIAARLQDAIEDFDMEEFGAMLEARPDEVSGDVFDTLMSLSDFAEFKGLMLAHKNARGGLGLVLEGVGGVGGGGGETGLELQMGGASISGAGLGGGAGGGGGGAGGADGGDGGITSPGGSSPGGAGLGMGGAEAKAAD